MLDISAQILPRFINKMKKERKQNKTNKQTNKQKQSKNYHI
jgi:hypothetical protein